MVLLSRSLKSKEKSKESRKSSKQSLRALLLDVYTLSNKGDEEGVKEKLSEIKAMIEGTTKIGEPLRSKLLANEQVLRMWALFKSGALIQDLERKRQK